MPTTLFEGRLTDGKLQVLLNLKLYFDEVGADPRGWGIMLAHTLQHIARAHAKTCVRDGESPDAKVVLDDILQAFTKEIEEPMDELHSGEVIGVEREEDMH